MAITNEYVFHRQQLRNKRPEFVIKTKYRMESKGENQTSYDWNAHHELVRRLRPKEYLEK